MEGLCCRFQNHDTGTRVRCQDVASRHQSGPVVLVVGAVERRLFEQPGCGVSALLALGLSAAQIRRSSQAMRTGVWSSDELVLRWQAWVAAHSSWRPDTYEGYQPLAVDITAFWRPRLQGWLGKFFYRVAPGRQRHWFRVGGPSWPQRRPTLAAAQADHPRRAGYAHREPVQGPGAQAGWERVAAHEVVVHDAGATLADMQTAQVARYVVRLDRNCTARRNVLPSRSGRQGRPTEYGAHVRPLARSYKAHQLAATPPDVMTQFIHAGRSIQVEGWRNVVRSDQKVAAANALLTIWVYHDPLYQDPLVLGTNLTAQAATIFQCIRPLAGRRSATGVQAVTGPAPPVCNCGRGTFPPAGTGPPGGEHPGAFGGGLARTATGFWDRQPRRTPGRLRRVLGQAGFPKEYPLAGRIREKQQSPPIYPKGSQHIAAAKGCN